MSVSTISRKSSADVLTIIIGLYPKVSAFSWLTDGAGAVTHDGTLTLSESQDILEILRSKIVWEII